jgi:MscS family membrane protein
VKNRIRLSDSHAHLRRLVAASLCVAALVTFGQDPVHPLKPPDRSSPRAALKTFLDSGDAAGLYLAREYLPAPSHAKFNRLLLLSETTLYSLDMSEVPQAARIKRGRAAAIALYETLSRIQLPPYDEIPAAEPSGALVSTNAVTWTIPNTEIALARTSSGEFLFTPQTVARADEFFQRVRNLPCTRQVPFEKVLETMGNSGGWLIPYTWIQALPHWCFSSLANEPLWKWLTLALVLGVFLLLLRLVLRLSHWGSHEHPFLRALARVLLPGFFLLAVPLVSYLALVQINLRGSNGSTVGLIATVIIYFSAAWLSWRAALVVAEALISSPRIAPEGVDAHLIRLCTRLLGLVAWAWFLVMGADRVGIPAYGVVAGLGVGGLAIALAAQPTIENLIGGFSLFADKPVRVGDLCRCGEDEGTVEAIGLRSTRIRGLDRTLTTIPNAALAKLAIENFSERDRILIQTTIGVRYETSLEQLRFLLATIRELLMTHPRIHKETARARLVGFGESSLDIELFAFATTRDRIEFLSIREDILLRVMELVEQSGTALAYPSQTLYFSKDSGLDSAKSEKAKAQVRQWRQEGHPALSSFLPETPIPAPEGSAEKV